MRPITNEDIKVLGRIVNISTENVVADASQVYDSNLHKDQQWLNNYFDSKTGNATTSKYGIVRLAASKNDPDNNDVPTIKILRDAIQDAISFILEDPGNTLLDNLNSIKELADALNNDPSFWTWVRDQLALKANESEFRTLVGRVDDIDRRVTELEICCQQVRQYMNEFSLTWSPARGGNHVTISPNVLRAGNRTATFDVATGYIVREQLTQSNIASFVDGDYDSVTISDIHRDDANNIISFQLDFTGVRSNIEINAHVDLRQFNVTRTVTGPASITFSNVNNTVDYGASYTCTATVSNADDRYTINMWGTYYNTYTPIVQIGTTKYSTSQLRAAGGQASSTAYNKYYDECSQNITITIPASLITDDITFIVPTLQATESLIRFEFDPASQTEYGAYTNNDIPIGQYSSHMYPVLYHQGDLDGYDYYVNLIDSTNHSPYYSLAGSTITITNGTNQLVSGTHFTWRYVSSGIHHGKYRLLFTPSAPSDATTYTATIHLVHYPVIDIVNVGTGRFDTIEQYPPQTQPGDRFYDVITPYSDTTINSVSVTMDGAGDITSSVVSALSQGEYEVDIPQVTGDVVITVNTTGSGTTPTYGTVTVSPNHGTASPSTFSADGTSHTVTITPASGYTTTGMTATSNNNDVSTSVSGNKITVTGTSSNNATITVTLPAEGTPTPSGPATVNVVLSNPNAGTANPASGTATSGNFSSNISFNYSSGYDANDSYLVVTDNDGNIIADGVSGYGVSYTYSNNSPTYSSISLTGLQDNKIYTATVYVVSPLGDVIFDAYGRTNEFGDTHRKGILNYGGSEYGSSAGDYSTANPHTAGYAYGEIVLPDISTFNVSGSTNEEKVRNLVNNTTFQLSKIDNNGVISGSVFVLSADSNTPFSFTNGASVTGNTYISNTNNINIRLNGTTPVIDVVCDRFVNDTPSTDTYTITDGHPVVDSDPIFRDSNYGTHTTIEEATSGSRQYIDDSTWTDVLTMYNNTNGVLLFSRIFRYGYAIRNIEPVVATSGNGSVQYQAYAFPLSAIDHYEYVITDGSNNTIDSGNITVQDDVNNAVLPNSVNTTTYPVHTVTVTAVPKSTASASSVVSTMTYDYSS